MASIRSSFDFGPWPKRHSHGRTRSRLPGICRFLHLPISKWFLRLRAHFPISSESANVRVPYQKRVWKWTNRRQPAWSTANTRPSGNCTLPVDKFQPFHRRECLGRVLENTMSPGSLLLLTESLFAVGCKRRCRCLRRPLLDNLIQGTKSLQIVCIDTDMRRLWNAST